MSKAFSNIRAKKTQDIANGNAALSDSAAVVEWLRGAATIPFMSVWKDSIILVSVGWQPIFEPKEAVSADQVKRLGDKNESEGKGSSAALGTSSDVAKWIRPCLLFTFQIGSQTLCKLLEVNHDDPIRLFPRWSKDGDFDLRGRRFR